MPDIYDEEIERLTKNPGNIESSWIGCRPLFAYAQSDVSGDIEEDKENRISAGCLTMIKNAPFRYGVILNGKLHKELTEQIAQDSRLPNEGGHIGLKHLPVFAEWQRKLDQLRNQ
jgi:hypothetical protein